MENIRRFNKSAERMSMASVDEGLFLNALIELIKLDEQWVPDGSESSLYIRPFMFASEAHVGFVQAHEYRFIIFHLPSWAYYKGNVRVKVETFFTRRSAGWNGLCQSSRKLCSFASSRRPWRPGEGYDQILWTDAVEHKYIEESGTMNVVFVLNGKLVSPSVGDTVLSGVTRDSVLRLAAYKGYEIEESKVAVAELKAGAESGALTEAFGVGTAATMTSD